MRYDAFDRRLDMLWLRAMIERLKTDQMLRKNGVRWQLF